jgi:hypothetical protein
MKTSRALRILVAAITFGVAADALSAQTTEGRPMYELPTLAVVASTTPIDSRAEALYTGGRWNEAARVYQDAAEARASGDAKSYEAYDLAARLYFYGRNFGTAREMMERAAEVAEATGDVVSAAYRHVDAAFIAVWEGYPGSRREHVAAAEAHAAREGVGEEHVRRIRALIYGVSSLPVPEESSEANARS